MDLTPRLHLMNWLVSQGLTGLPENDLLRGFCERCRAEGLELSRGLVAIDTLHMLTSFETFDALAKNRAAFRAAEHQEVVEIIRKLADHAIGFRPRFVPPSDPPSDTKALTKRRHQ